MFADYASHCEAGLLKPGGIHVYKDDSMPYIFNVATKNHWRNPSRIEWVEAAIPRILQECRAEGIVTQTDWFPKLKAKSKNTTLPQLLRRLLSNC
jgi:hypothetical protein